MREKLKLGVRIYFSVLRLASASTAALIMGTQFGLRAASLKYRRDSSGRLSRPLDFVFKINCSFFIAGLNLVSGLWADEIKLSLSSFRGERTEMLSPHKVP